jgi:hypothetical protein
MVEGKKVRYYSKKAGGRGFECIENVVSQDFVEYNYI